jgi:hypothetical protein
MHVAWLVWAAGRWEGWEGWESIWQRGSYALHFETHYVGHQGQRERQRLATACRGKKKQETFMKFCQKSLMDSKI